MADWILKELKRFRRYDPQQPVYLRYGLWGRRSYNAQTGEGERGVSVYRARVIDGIVHLDDQPSPQLDGQGRVAFALQGEVNAIGSDGEPVLKSVKLIPLPIALTARIV